VFDNSAVNQFGEEKYPHQRGNQGDSFFAHGCLLVSEQYDGIID
jgi:hypothetical protein